MWVPHPGPGGLPAALMSVETEAQATRGFVHVRLAHGCSLGVAQGHPGPHLDGFLGWGDGLQRCNGIMPLPPYPPRFRFNRPCGAATDTHKATGSPAMSLGLLCSTGSRPTSKADMGTNGDGMGTDTHAAPCRCPQASPCMAGVLPVFPQTDPSIWESKFAAVGRCGSLWVVWGHEPQHQFSLHKKATRQVAATGHLFRNLPVALH